MKEQSTKEAFMRDFIKAQKEMRPAIKDAKNPRFQSNYSDISSVLNACMEALYSNNLAMTQPVEHKEIGMVVTTRITHVTGEFIETSLPLMMQKQDMQGLGSAITYARRYGLTTLLGIPEDDDDANLVTEFNPPKSKAKSKPKPRAKPKKVNSSALQCPEGYTHLQWLEEYSKPYGGLPVIEKMVLDNGGKSSDEWTNAQISVIIHRIDSGKVKLERVEQTEKG